MSKTKDATPTYTKQQFLSSKRFTPQQKDVLHALLEEGNAYSDAQVKKLIDDFMKKGAK